MSSSLLLFLEDARSNAVLRTTERALRYSNDRRDLVKQKPILWLVIPCFNEAESGGGAPCDCSAIYRLGARINR